MYGAPETIVHVVVRLSIRTCYHYIKIHVYIIDKEQILHGFVQTMFLSEVLEDRNPFIIIIKKITPNLMTAESWS